MAKKDIISKRRTSDDGGLRKGQTVVLMDSSLRGRIVSIGRTVGIELEDGLMIEAAVSDGNIQTDNP